MLPPVPTPPPAVVYYLDPTLQPTANLPPVPLARPPVPVFPEPPAQLDEPPVPAPVAPVGDDSPISVAPDPAPDPPAVVPPPVALTSTPPPGEWRPANDNPAVELWGGVDAEGVFRWTRWRYRQPPTPHTTTPHTTTTTTTGGGGIDTHAWRKNFDTMGSGYEWSAPMSGCAGGQCGLRWRMW
jgi:hypothetical protein